MSSEWSEYFETITQFVVGASRQYGVANGSFTEYVVDRLDLVFLRAQLSKSR